MGIAGQIVITGTLFKLGTYSPLFLIEEILHLAAENLVWVCNCPLELVYSETIAPIT